MSIAHWAHFRVHHGPFQPKWQGAAGAPCPQPTRKPGASAGAIKAWAASEKGSGLAPTRGGPERLFPFTAQLSLPCHFGWNGPCLRVRGEKDLPTPLSARSSSSVLWARPKGRPRELPLPLFHWEGASLPPRPTLQSSEALKGLLLHWWFSRLNVRTVTLIVSSLGSPQGAAQRASSSVTGLSCRSRWAGPASRLSGNRSKH